MNPTMTAGRPTPAQGYQIVWFMQAGVGVAAKPPMVNTVGGVANVSSAAHAPIAVALQHCGTSL